MKLNVTSVPFCRSPSQNGVRDAVPVGADGEREHDRVEADDQDRGESDPLDLLAVFGARATVSEHERCSTQQARDGEEDDQRA